MGVFPVLCRRTLIGPLAASILTLAGCAGDVPKPTERLALAQAAIAGAEQAEAERHAPMHLQAARHKLDLAQAAIADENFLLARRLAIEAEADAQLSEATARSQTAQQTAAELQESIAALRREARRQGGT